MADQSHENMSFYTRLYKFSHRTLWADTQVNMVAPDSGKSVGHNQVSVTCRLKFCLVEVMQPRWVGVTMKCR